MSEHADSGNHALATAEAALIRIAEGAHNPIWEANHALTQMRETQAPGTGYLSRYSATADTCTVAIAREVEPMGDAIVRVDWVPNHPDAGAALETFLNELNAIAEAFPAADAPSTERKRGKLKARWGR